MAKNARKPKGMRVLERPDVIASIISDIKLSGGNSVAKDKTSPQAIWRFKLRREGKLLAVKDRAKELYAASKDIPKHAHSSYHNALVCAMQETGYTKEAAWKWYVAFIESCTNLEREKWTEYMAETMKLQDRVNAVQEATNPDDNWRREDLPDDIAWVASRPCLLSERQSQKEAMPLGPEDFIGCPSPQARFMLDSAFKEPQQFLDQLIKMQVQQWSKRKVDVSEKTKEVVAEVKEEVAEVKVVDRSEAQRLLEQALKRYV